jgi:hypothetical protein
MFKKSSFKGPWLELAFANDFGFRFRFRFRFRLARCIA